LKHDSAIHDDLDPIEAAFFQAAPSDLDAEPSVLLPRETRLVINAGVSMLAIAFVALTAFVIHSEWLTPPPEPHGASELVLPQPPPTAARVGNPNEG
jgi:hypothetical protein